MSFKQLNLYPLIYQAILLTYRAFTTTLPMSFKIAHIAFTNLPMSFKIAHIAFTTLPKSFK